MTPSERAQARERCEKATAGPWEWQGDHLDGRHVEFGIAVATGKRVLMVGERENVFHWLPGVEVYATFDAAKAALGPKEGENG